MKKERLDLSFEEWIACVFGPAPDEMDPDALEPAVSVAYLTKLFEHAPHVLMPFSETQIAQGLWYLVSARSSHLYELLNPDVAWSERQRCISSIFTLFERFFSPRCSSYFSDGKTQETESNKASPLTTICYMWWDSLPIAGTPDDPSRIEVDRAFLDVMGRLLDLPAAICQESALHGLGHWHLTYPHDVEALIDRFLDRHPDLPSELREYALDAHKGLVQ